MQKLNMSPSYLERSMLKDYLVGKVGGSPSINFSNP